MNHKRNASTETEEEHRSYQVVQILKKDIMDESQSSENSNQFEQPTSKTTHTKTKKSLFATLIKRKHSNRPKMKITKKIETCSTINFGTESLSSDQELAHYQYSSETVHGPVAPKASCPVRKAKQYNFFKKIIKRSNAAKASGLSRKHRHCPDPNNCDKRNIKALTLGNVIPTTYIPKYNIKLINGMNELQDILHNLHHSEEHMVYMLKKYIEDKNIEKQLFEASFEYFALQYDSKCHATALGDKLWFQQLEIVKVQDYNLQKRLNCLVKNNRMLESQVETLCRQCEKLADRSNIYPKRFLHMRSFGKIYARQLIDNNRKLQKRMYALTGIISDFEEELQKLQHQKTVLEEEKRAIKSQIYHLEGAVEQRGNDFELEKSALMLQLSHQDATMKEAAAAAQFIFQDLRDFEYQLAEFSITISWPNFQYQDVCLCEMIYQVRGCVGEFILTMITAYREAATVAKEVTKLRNTNARLQENLQKSTKELDNLSKKFEKTTEIDANALEGQCNKLQQENCSLKLKLENTNERNTFLREEMELKKKTLSETKTSVNDLMTQNQALITQIDEIVLAIAQLASNNEFSKEFSSSQEKLNYVRLRYDQILTDRQHLAERCSTLEEENQSLHQVYQAYQQDFNTLQDGVTIISAENDTIKKQLATEHQTVTTLQNERLKYLEEKNILKTIFQHLKSEVSRIQQLEGAVADMSKETNRLSLIAEFNKQLGEQLKSEVEMKDNTITELRHSLEKLSHIQLDNDKEKMTLCAQLSEISNVKAKLSDCLEMELKKNLHLDESKKKLECSTKSQLKIYEEMQKNERAALKELLKDFKNLIKQRDCLVHMQEENRKTCKDIEKHYLDLRKEYEGAVAQIEKREDELKRAIGKLQEQEELIRQQEENRSSEVAKYEKGIKKLEKLVGQIRNEKGEFETSVMYLKNNLQKLENDFNETREQKVVTENKLAIKTAEYATLESELNAYKNELQMLSQEHGKVTLELEYMKKLHEQKTAELKDTISCSSTKDNMYLETKTAVFNKEQQISELNRVIVEKEGEVIRKEQECAYLRKQNEDQNRIMVGYENQLVILQDAESVKVQIEKELISLQAEHKKALSDLESAKKENDKLKNEKQALIVKTEHEKSFYKNQTSEIIFEYSEQKATIEEEIDSISHQLCSVTESLHKEKKRFEELAKAHDELQVKYIELKDKCNSEVTANKETNRKIESMDSFIKAIAMERDNLQKQVHLLLLDISEEKEANLQLTSENKKIQMILEQGRQQYGSLVNKNSYLEKQLREVKCEMKGILNTNDSSQDEIDKIVKTLEEKESELKSSKETIECLKKELSENQKTLFDLKEEFFKLQQQVTGLEFKNCELTLQLHETNGRLETERNLYKELKICKSQTPEPTPPRAPSECGELFSDLTVFQ